MDLLHDLNSAQAQAVTYLDGHQLVVAGAGSGKTRMLTYKIAYLIQQGYQPERILALTFTNKAAEQMRQRVAKLIGQSEAGRLKMGTFHSVFARMLRMEAQTIGYRSDFTIYDDGDSKAMLNIIIKEIVGREEEHINGAIANDKSGNGKGNNIAEEIKKYRVADVQSKISLAKNRLILPREYAEDHQITQRNAEQSMPLMPQIYEAYCHRCRLNNVMDFDDLLIQTYLLLKNDEAVRTKYSNYFSYILVDEYQDTNRVQQKIISLLTSNVNRVCAVGDDSQSIYGFRGAHIDNILDFSNQFGGAKLFKLERNYRSTQNIVEAANTLISNNSKRIEKHIYSQNEDGDKIKIIKTQTDTDEAETVIREIKRIKRLTDCDYDHFAILYRTNAQSRSFEEKLRMHGLPYRIYGGLGFYQRKEIKDITAYFRVLINRDDEEAVRRIINYPARGIGKTTQDKVFAAARRAGRTVYEVISNSKSFVPELSAATHGKLNAFVEMIERLGKEATANNVFELGVKVIAETDIQQDLASSNTPEYINKRENVEEFVNAMRTFVDDRAASNHERPVLLHEYMQEIALQTDVESNDVDEKKIMLMTMHAAKGLEFENVFVVGLESNSMPGQIVGHDGKRMEEERRLLYVAITRAEKRCVLSFAVERYRYGKKEYSEECPFLNEIDAKYIEDLREHNSARPVIKNRYSMDEYMPSKNDFRERTYGFGGAKKPSSWSSLSGEIRANSSSGTVTEGHSSGVFKKLKRISSAPTEALVKREEATTPEGIKIHVGDKIKHKIFGVGSITGITGTGMETKLSVTFEKSGNRQLLLKYATIEVL